MDLRVSFPPSPFATLEGFPWLPRLLAKARALLAGTNGEYTYPCPMDRQFLAFFRLDAEALLSELRHGANDAAMVEFIRARMEPRDEQAIEAFRTYLLLTPPAPGASLEAFLAARDEVAPDRLEVDTWAKLSVVEEGHAWPLMHA